MVSKVGAFLSEHSVIIPNSEYSETGIKKRYDKSLLFSILVEMVDHLFSQRHRNAPISGKLESRVNRNYFTLC